MYELLITTSVVAGLTMALIYFISKNMSLQSKVYGMESKLVMNNVDLELENMRLGVENGDLKCQLNK